MFCRDFMPRTNDAPLQKRERGLDAVRGDASPVLIPDIFLHPVVNRLVLYAAHGPASISRIAVGDENLDIGADVFPDVLCQRSSASVLSVEEAKLPVALLDANDSFLSLVSQFLSISPLPSAHVGLIHFNNAVQHRGLVSRRHSRPDAMAQIPRRLVGAFMLAPDRPLELHRAHALLRFADQERGKEPYRQAKVGVVKDRAARHRKLVLTPDAFKPGIILDPGDPRILAARTRNAFRPAEPFKQLPATCIG